MLNRHCKFFAFTLSSQLVLLSQLLAERDLPAQQEIHPSFNPGEIKLLINPDIDIVYHCLAYFSVPGDASNLYSVEYLQQIRKAKQDLEVGQTKLDSMAAELEKTYREKPRLRFLNLAPFMADDYASFKQALLMIDYRVEKEKPPDSRETLEQRKAREEGSALLFGNAKRLIPLFRNRFPDPAEQQFIKQFAECMDEEHTQFYKAYREARTEIDQQNLERFERLWKSEGSKLLWPWAAKSGVNTFNIYLTPVMRNNGRGVPVKEEQSIHFNVVAPLPETSEQANHALFVILHETTHRLTDHLVEAAKPASEADASALRESAAFYADHVYLKGRYPSYHAAYLKFFLNLPDSKQFSADALEAHFLKSYPVSASLKAALDDLVKKL